eukprot:3791936-Rhodomonas_salina.4
MSAPDVAQRKRGLLPSENHSGLCRRRIPPFPRSPTRPVSVGHGRTQRQPANLTYRSSQNSVPGGMAFNGSWFDANDLNPGACSPTHGAAKARTRVTARERKRAENCNPAVCRKMRYRGSKRIDVVASGPESSGRNECLAATSL